MAGGLGGDHGDVHAVGGDDGLEVYVEAVREHEGLAGQKVGQDGLAVHLGLDVVGYEHHDDVGLAGGILDQAYLEAVGFGLRYAATALVEADHDIEAGILQVEGVGVSLAAVADDADGLVLDQGHVGVVFVVHLCHVEFP